jgi:hypothetical protein
VRKALAVALGGWLMGLLALGAIVFNPGGESPSGAGAAALVMAAAINSKEGQGDLLCGPAGPAGAGATVAALAAARAGWTGQDLLIAVAIAGAESTWNPDAMNRNSNGSTDYGMWQINSVHVQVLASGDWRDPYDNALMARKVWAEAGSSWTPWVTFNTGAYLTHLDTARTAVAGGDVAMVQPCVPTGGGGVQGGTDHLTPWTRALSEEAHRLYPTQVIGCYNPASTWGEHGLGRACDIMSTPEQGAVVALWAQQNAVRLHVMYIIWQQHIWSPSRADEGWRLMADRGSPTQNHMDHVHVSVLE